MSSGFSRQRTQTELLPTPPCHTINAKECQVLFLREPLATSIFTNLKIFRRDLLRPDGVPWEVALPTIAKSRPVLRDLLLRDGLVTEGDLSECLDMFPSARARPQTLLYHFGQPFHLPFEGVQHITIVIGSKKYLSRIAVFQEQRGKAVVRFEVSPLPEHANGRVVLRVVKMIEPPKLRIPHYDGYLPRPTEGELIYRPGQGRRVAVKPWSRSLASRLGEPLRLLLNARQLSNTS
ncbi:hypothetical protein K438DRAFT_1960446 [Mycena galopus ATCC 62051]|nr:hypothetical protein K438DRAFT_1960446 [Mycena galopus ATCC 62051]